MARELEHEPRGEELRVARARLGRQQRGTRRQVLELEEQLGGVVASRVEGEGLRKDPLEPLPAVALEADLARVEGVGEAEGQMQPLDPQLQPVERRGGSARGPVQDRRRRAQRTDAPAFSPVS